MPQSRRTSERGASLEPRRRLGPSCRQRLVPFLMRSAVRMTGRAESDNIATRDAVSDDLRQIVLEGADLLDEADQVVAECKQLDDHGAGLAHRGHHVASGYFALRNRIAQLPATDLSRQVEQWLNFEQQIVEQALILGYRPDSPNKARVAEHFGDPDGAAAAHLRDLAARSRNENPR